MPDVPQPIHLRPVATLAQRVLLPGDPGRALALAQVVLGDDRKMFNHHRGLWGYTGTAADGAPLTIQSTGMGGPSAAIVLEELAALGVRTAVRVGTARALAGTVALGDLVAATAVHGADGVSRALGASGRRPLDGAVTAHLTQVATRAGLIVSTDLFYAVDDESDGTAWTADGALAVDLESAPLAAVAARHGLAFGAIVAVIADAHGGRLGEEAVAQAGEAVGVAGAGALTSG
ncbi:MAG: uridine phosphorylase [Baekduia sp.]|nr:uridine phosphorylase [Baekduia sp.]